MVLNHIGFGVTDVKGTVHLFETYFGLMRAPQTPFNDKMAFVIDDAGSLITLFKADDAVYPQIFHMGFMQQTFERVQAIRAQLVAGGFEPGEIREEHGRMTFYFKAPGNFVVEVNSLSPEQKTELKQKVNEN